jgi:rubrerythrin
MRRRARYLRQLRELQLRDIGGFMVELHRFGRRQPDLVDEKVTAAAQTHTELRTLEDALQENRSLGEVRKAGIGGACPACGTVHGSADRFCPWCGHQL